MLDSLYTVRLISSNMHDVSKADNPDQVKDAYRIARDNTCSDTEKKTFSVFMDTIDTHVRAGLEKPSANLSRQDNDQMINGFRNIRDNVHVLRKSELNWFKKFILYFFPESNKSEAFHSETEMHQAHAEQLLHIFEGKRFKQAVEASRASLKIPEDRSFLPTLAENGVGLFRGMAQRHRMTPDHKMTALRRDFDQLIEIMSLEGNNKEEVLKTLLQVSASDSKSDDLGAVYELITANHELSDENREFQDQFRKAIQSIEADERVILEDSKVNRHQIRMEQIQMGKVFKRKIPRAYKRIKSTKPGEAGFDGDQLTRRLLKSPSFREEARKLIADFPKSQRMTPKDKLEWLKGRFDTLMTTQIKEGEKLPDGWPVFAFTAMVMAGNSKKMDSLDLGAFYEFIRTEWSMSDTDIFAIVHMNAYAGIEAVEQYSREAQSG